METLKPNETRLPVEHVIGHHSIWWKIELAAAMISIEERPAYCDRGRYIVKLAVRDHRALHIDDADGWPRYYFDWDRMLAEIEAWCDVRGLR